MANFVRSLFYYLEHILSFRVVLFTILFCIHRECSAQGVIATFDCSTLQPTIQGKTLVMGEESSGQYIITVDQPYYQQGSVRRVTVSGQPPFSSLYVQARIKGGDVIGGWTSPLPQGYTFTQCGSNGQAIIKTDSVFRTTAVFEWRPPFTDTSSDVIFMVTFVSSSLYYIIMSNSITDPCMPNPCQSGDVCFRGSTAPGYVCADPCSIISCENGGTCTRGASGLAECLCPIGLTGTNCESCDAQFCLNGGWCIINQGGNAQCLCPGTWMGTRCEIPRGGNACTSNPCLNQGTCSVTPTGGYSCACTTAYLGNNCQIVDPCLSVSCENGGTCVRSGGGTFASCQCPDGFSGVRCELSDGFCSRGFCLNGATCIAFTDGSGGLCQCADGYSGPYCETTIDDDFCQQNLCLNGATCMPLSSLGTGGQCLCPTGFTGSLCGYRIQGASGQPSFCEQSPCMNGGSCWDLPMGGGQCQCPSDFTGSRCEQPRDEECFLSVCLNGGSCIHVSPSAGQCRCAEGFTGPNCEQEASPRGPCSMASTRAICLNGATCVDTAGGFTCVCQDGYTGFDCSDTTDAGICATIMTDICLNGGTCMDTDSGFSCLCPEGYTGFTCDVAIQTGFCASVTFDICLNGGTCTDTDSGFSCLCPEGYTGFTCDEAIQTGPCSMASTRALCMNGATCVDTPGGFTCVCLEGYTGFDCSDTTDADPCAPNPCFNGGACSPIPDTTAASGYRCDCTSDYVGLLCQTVNPCSTNPCRNSGTCQVNQETGQYTCLCRIPDLYMGDNCEIVSPCLSNPCLNGGRCSYDVVSNSRQCTCPESYRGDNCQSFDVCRTSSPCRNGATCFYIAESDYYCHCTGGYSGTDCEMGAPCSPDPCTNGGTCSIVGSSFRCQCPPHTLGATCNIGNPCSSTPCVSGSTCSPAPTGLSYSCVCPPGLTGTNCQTSIDVCRNSPCINGTCVRDLRAATQRRCECFDGYDGDFCDNVADFCLAMEPCNNGGTCSNVNPTGQQFTCMCPGRYLGDTCLFDRNAELVFDNCPNGEITYSISSGNTAYITLEPIARVPETDELIDEFEIIVGPPGQEFPGDVEYDETYLEGQTFALRAYDEFGRQGTCSFTVKLLDQVPPVITCPEDHEDVSQTAQVRLASLPLPFINVTDNVGIREENPIVFDPPMIKTNGQQETITVTTFDEAGNSMECQFGLRVHQNDDACQTINGVNGMVFCSIEGSQNTRTCRQTCDKGFAAINGVSYTCNNGEWDRQPLPCAGKQIPNSLSKVIRFIYPVIDPCMDGDSRFFIDAQEAMREELDRNRLCDLGNAMTCTADSIEAVCTTLEGGDTPQRQRRQASEAVAIDVTVTGVIDESGEMDQEKIRADINVLISMLETASLDLSIGGETVAYDSATASPRFSSICGEGSVSQDGNCLNCPAGSMHDAVANECILCSPGHYQDEEGQTSCEPCKPEQFQNISGATSCQTCPTSRSLGEVECIMNLSAPIDWVMIIIYACVGIGALLIIIIFILMVCLWRSTQEEKRQDLKRWELGQLTQQNNSYESEEETGFRQRMDTTVSATTYQTVPEGDGTPNLGNGYTSSLVPIPVDELYAGLTVDSQGNTIMVGVDHHGTIDREHRGRNRYHHDSHGPSNGFSHDRHNFNV